MSSLLLFSLSLAIAAGVADIVVAVAVNFVTFVALIVFFYRIIVLRCNRNARNFRNEKQTKNNKNKKRSNVAAAACLNANQLVPERRHHHASNVQQTLKVGPRLLRIAPRAHVHAVVPFSRRILTLIRAGEVDSDRFV